MSRVLKAACVAALLSTVPAACFVAAHAQTFNERFPKEPPPPRERTELRPVQIPNYQPAPRAKPATVVAPVAPAITLRPQPFPPPPGTRPAPGGLPSGYEPEQIAPGEPGPQPQRSIDLRSKFDRLPQGPTYGGPSPPPPIRSSVRLTPSNGVFRVPVLLNGAVAIDMMVDSGAADVLVSEEVFHQLEATGAVVSGDKQYHIADGRSVRAHTFIIKSLKVGDIVLENVEAAFGPGPTLLLGQAFLKRLSSWSIDNTAGVLIIEMSAGSAHVMILPPAPSIPILFPK
jgi:clan AA aspartic protease (TIGR02281 family)